MPVVKNEQEEKRQSQFLKYRTSEEGNSLRLLSHLYRIDFHYLPEPIKRSVICKGEECSYCKKGHQKRAEYNYLVNLNGEIGLMDIKPSVFFVIQGVSKAQKKDPRQISWTVIKTGEGLNTEYTTSKDDNLEKAEYDALNKELDANTDKLTVIMEKKEEQLKQAYVEYESRVTPVKSKKQEGADEPPTPDEES